MIKIPCGIPSFLGCVVLSLATNKYLFDNDMVNNAAIGITS